MHTLVDVPAVNIPARALEADAAERWQTDLNEPNKFEVSSMAVSPESVVAVVRYQNRVRSQPRWFVAHAWLWFCRAQDSE